MLLIKRNENRIIKLIKKLSFDNKFSIKFKELDFFIHGNELNKNAFAVVVNPIK